MSDRENKKDNLQLFFITEANIKALIKKDPEAADLIGAFCVVSLHTDKSGRYSSAGAKSIQRAIGVGNPRANRLLDRLYSRGLIRPAAELSGKLKTEMPQREGKAAVRWIIPPDGSRKIWLPAELVRGISKWQRPLVSLAQAGNDAARILLACYLYEDPIQFGGIDPARAVYRKYATTENIGNDLLNGRVLMTCDDENITAMFDFEKELRGFECDEEGSIPDFWRAFTKLYDCGFLTERVTVFTGEEVSSEMRLLYPLHFFTKTRHPPASEGKPLSGSLHSLASVFGVSLADEGGIFNHRRFAFLADDERAQVVGIYVPRFRNTYPEFEDVATGWAILCESKKTWAETVSFLLERLR